MHAFYSHPIVGMLRIKEEDGYIVEIKFISEDEKIMLEKEDFGKQLETELLRKAVAQLQEYFQGERKKFDLPVKPKGTEFMMDVYNALLEVPYGETASYKDIAIKIGREKACRAVGNANNKNPIAIIIPCHRIIGHDGRLVGYEGGLEIKKALLSLENSISQKPDESGICDY